VVPALRRRHLGHLLPDRGLRFVLPLGERNTPLKGLALLYLGADAAGFCRVFARLGFVVITITFGPLL